MTPRRGILSLLAGVAMAASLAIGAGADPVRGVGPLPLSSPPVPIPSLPLPSLPVPVPSLPQASLPVPVPSLPVPSLPLPSVPAPTIPPLPSFPLPLPSPGLPLPSIGQPTPGAGSPSPAPGDASPDASDAPDGASGPSTSDRDDTEPPGAPGDDVTGGVSGGIRGAPFARPLVLEAPPLPPSLADVGSWLVPGLAVAVPALLVAGLVALEILSGALGVRVARGGLDRIGAVVPHWLCRGDHSRRSRGQPT